jgi:hypothetical protein
MIIRKTDNREMLRTPRTEICHNRPVNKKLPMYTIVNNCRYVYKFVNMGTKCRTQRVNIIRNPGFIKNLSARILENFLD